MHIKQIIQLGAISTVNICINFVFQMFILAQLGPGVETDALIAGMTIPQIVLAVISGSLMHVLVPILASESEVSIRCSVWSLIVFFGAIFGLISIFLYLTASWWIPLSVPGFTEANICLTIELTRIQLIGNVFAGISVVQCAASYVRQKFLLTELVLFSCNLIALLLLILALPRYGVIAAAWVYTIRMILQALLLFPGIGKPALPNLKAVVFNKIWEKIKPLLLGATYYKTDPFIDRFLLSSANNGSLTLYFLAQQIYGAISQVLSKAITTPTIAVLSKLNVIEDYAIFHQLFKRKCIEMGLISFAIFVTIVIFGQTIFFMLLENGSLRKENIVQLWWIMISLGGMFVAGSIGEISSSTFYASSDTATPTRIGIFTYTFYIPVKILVFYLYGLVGLSLVTSLYVLINLLIQIYLINKKMKLMYVDFEIISKR